MKMNIYEKLSAITNELSTVAKNLEVGFGKSKYKAVGEADVLRAVKPLEAQYKVYSYPYKREIIESGILEKAEIDKETKAEVIKKSFYERIEVIYRFVNIENPDEFIDITTYGDGIDSQDKSVGKAMTYADKYALLKAYKIVTGDDPDQEASGNVVDVNFKKEELKAELLSEVEELAIDLDKVAMYYKKTREELTNNDLKKAIGQKKKALERVGKDD